MKIQTQRIREEWRRSFKTDESKFIMLTGLKVSLISFTITATVYVWLYELMRLNWVFFKSQGFPEFFGEASFYDYLISEAVENVYLLVIFHICLFFIGCYLGWLILRPFRTIGTYAEKVIENPNTEYKLEDFSTYKLLSRFSEFFFEYLRESRRKGVIAQNSIPPQYSRIHKPVPDRIFMLHFGLLMIIIAISSIVFIIENASVVFTNLGELAGKTLTNNRAAASFISDQVFILDDIVVLIVTLVSVGYFFLGVHLYEKVSGAAFGIFSTMRAFMKGNHFSRVHLVGYSYVREHTRKLNKYLDYIQNNLSKEDPKG